MDVAVIFPKTVADPRLVEIVLWLFVVRVVVWNGWCEAGTGQKRLPRDVAWAVVVGVVDLLVVDLLDEKKSTEDL